MVLLRWEILRLATTKYFRELAEWKTGGKAMYRGREEMALRRKFKAYEMTTWFWAKRGGKDSKEQKMSHQSSRRVLDGSTWQLKARTK